MSALSVDVHQEVRRAALTLHALAPADRAWMLDRLNPSQRSLLQELLAELESLGIPQDVALIRDALASAPTFVARTGADSKALCEALCREPSPRLRSLWLSALNEADREAVLGHWSLPLEERPRPVAAPGWSATVRESVLQSWHDAVPVVEANP